MKAQGAGESPPLGTRRMATVRAAMPEVKAKDLVAPSRSAICSCSASRVGLPERV